MTTTSSNSKCVVITGASRGLGRAMAKQFCDLDWTVIGCARDPNQVQQLNKTHNPPHRWDVVDVQDALSVQQWAHEIVAAYGPPRLLINNAAVINTPRPLWEVPVAEFSDVLQINIAGVFHVLRAFTPAMCQAANGVIVNFSSGWGRSTSPQMAPYCASKWAIEGLTQAFAQELPTGMAAIALNPGIINTEMLQSCWGEGSEQYPTPDQWSRQAVPYLLSLSAADNGRSCSVPST